MVDNAFVGGLDGQKTPPPPPPESQALLDTVNRLNGRVRSFERSLSDLRDMIRFHEERSTKTTKEFTAKQKLLEEKQHALSDRLDQLQQTLSLVVKELQLTAKKEDVVVLQRVLELIKPTRFITQDRAEYLIHSILEEEGLKKKEVPEEERSPTLSYSH